MTKNIKTLCLLAVALVTMASCISNEDNSVRLLTGDWYFEMPTTGQCYDIRQGDQLVEVTYDHIGILINLNNGFGSWTHYYLKDGELVDYDGHYYADFSYQLDGKDYLHFRAEQPEDDDYSTPLDAYGLHYDAAQDVILSNPFEGVVMQFHRLTAQQRSRLNAWNAVIDQDHIGLDNSDYTTDMDAGHATEPSRVTQH